MASRKRRRTTVLTVDTGHRAPARFYTLMVAGGPDADTVREDLLVPEGDELRVTHRHDHLDEAA